jgi:hypothetical protein
VTLSERGQLLRNSGDLFCQSSEVLRLGGRGNNGALKKAIDLLGKCSNGLSLLGGRSGNSGCGRACKKVIDLLGQSGNIGGSSRGRALGEYGHDSNEVTDHLGQCIDSHVDLVEAAGDGGVILERGGLNGQGRGGTRSRRVWRARGLLARPFGCGLLGPRIQSRGCGIVSILLEDGGEAIVVRHREA